MNKLPSYLKLVLIPNLIGIGIPIIIAIIFWIPNLAGPTSKKEIFILNIIAYTLLIPAICTIGRGYGILYKKIIKGNYKSITRSILIGWTYVLPLGWITIAILQTLTMAGIYQDIIRKTTYRIVQTGINIRTIVLIPITTIRAYYEIKKSKESLSQ